jgi:hypothetical protein
MTLWSLVYVCWCFRWMCWLNLLLQKTVFASTRLHDVTSLNAVIFIFINVRISHLTFSFLVHIITIHSFNTLFNIIPWSMFRNLKWHILMNLLRSTIFTLTFLEAKSVGEGTDELGWCCFTVQVNFSWWIPLNIKLCKWLGVQNWNSINITEFAITDFQNQLLIHTFSQLTPVSSSILHQAKCIHYNIIHWYQ